MCGKLFRWRSRLSGQNRSFIAFPRSAHAMPSRAEIASEFEQARNAQDIIRRKHLKALADYTKRDTILFAARPQTPIVPDDIQGFMAAAHKLKGSELDL